jgi:glycosyltransferase involved in cell wall biosynthesis
LNYKISVAIITYNEEKNIRDCLESVKWADEIIVVDSGSTDATVEISREYTDKIQVRNWPGNIEQQTYAASICRNDWILSIDADERISKKLGAEIEGLNLGQDGIDCYLLPRRAFFMNRWINHSSWYPDYKPRLFNKRKGSWGGVSPHGIFVTTGKSKKLTGDILHFIGRDIVQYSNTVIRYADISAAAYFSSGKKFKWHQITIRPIYTFLYKYFLRLGFLDGVPGLAIAFLSSYGVFIKYLRLHDLESQKRLS